MEYREDADIRVNNKQCRGIILKGDKVLVMFRRKNGEEYYTFPGGHMRKGEEPVDTAKRELFEETTVKVKDLDLAYEFFNYAKPKKTEVDYYFVGYWDSGRPTLSGEESRRATEDNYYEPMWVKVGNISELILYPLAAKEWVIDSLEKYLKKRGE